MNLTQLEYFIHVARNGNISATAKDLYISQPTLSRSIAELEKELGAELFNRVGGRIQLNEKGEIFRDSVEQSFSHLHRGIITVQNMQEAERGSVRVAAVYSVGFMPDLIRDFYTKNPQIYISYQLGSGITAATSVADQMADFAIVTKDLNDERFEFITLADTPMYALISGINPLSNREEISLEELRTEQFLCNPFATSRQMTVDICGRAGFEPNVVMECNDQPLNELILERLPLVYLIPKTELENRATNFRYANSRIVRLKERITIPIILCWNKNRKFSKMAERFYEDILQYAKQYR